MSDIQIDMFEVQLGAALFLQFAVGGERVTVLADAGIDAPGYPVTHVRDQLLPILKENERRRVDLIIGTHYDKDHLSGLVPIIEDASIEIGEAWMPPIANDAMSHAFDIAWTDDDLLPHQFIKDDGEQVLAHYLQSKRGDYELVKNTLATQEEFQMPWLVGQPENQNSTIAENIQFFQNEYNELTFGDDCFHGGDQELEEGFAETFLHEHQMPQTGHQRMEFWRYSRAVVDVANSLWGVFPDAHVAMVASLTNIQRNIAKDAITAVALYEVVVALRRRRIPIRTEVIEDGIAKKYYWQSCTRRFARGTRGKSGLELVLLGPSRGLVRKHWNKLPVSRAALLALSFVAEIKSISPSNQLSYVMRFGHLEQGILVSGDAGFVDFKRSPRAAYYEVLLEALLPLHVIQVAHHGGRNAHFYRVLECAGFFDQKESSFLLLSHSTDDRHRPSDEFREFLMELLGAGDEAKVLFTSKPRTERVRDYLQNIHTRVGPGGNVGNVRLEFSGGTWDVKSHAIEI